MFDLLSHYFLSKAMSNLQIWASESDVIKETGGLVLSRRRPL